MLAGVGAGLAGVTVLRLSWAQTQRSVPLNTLAWFTLAAGSVLGWLAAGAWGLAVVALSATGAACLLLALAAVEQPRMVRRARTPPREDATMATAVRTSPARGWATFALAGPLALAVAVTVALAARRLALDWSATEADGNVMVLALVPLVWPLLACALLMSERRHTQLALLAVPLALALIPLLLTGNAA